MNNIKIFFLGAAHFFLQDYYPQLIETLIFAELLAIAAVIVFEVKFRCYKQGFFFGATLLSLLCMVMLNIAMLTDWRVCKAGMGAEARDLADQILTQTIYIAGFGALLRGCLLYTSPSPRDKRQSRMPSSA